MVDTSSAFDGAPPNGAQTDAWNYPCRDTCFLQLINIIMGDVYYEQLISDSRANPWWGKIDQRKTGPDSQLWIHVLKSFNNDTFTAKPNIQTGDPQFQDRPSNPLDISKCLLPWQLIQKLCISGSTVHTEFHS
jgi:hypothetical protein